MLKEWTRPYWSQSGRLEQMVHRPQGSQGLCWRYQHCWRGEECGLSSPCQWRYTWCLFPQIGVVFLILRDKHNPDDIHKWHTCHTTSSSQNALDLVKYLRGGGSVQGQQGILWLLVISSPVVFISLWLSQEVYGPTVRDLHKWSSGPPDLSRGPDLVPDPKTRELQFGCGNLGNWLAGVFTDRLADVCNGFIVKLRQSLSIFEHLHIVQSSRGIGIETKLLDIPRKEILAGVGIPCHLLGPSRSPCYKGTVLYGCCQSYWSYWSLNATPSGRVVVVVPLLILTRSQMGLMNWGNRAIGQGAMVMRLKTIGRGQGGHSCKSTPICHG